MVKDLLLTALCQSHPIDFDRRSPFSEMIQAFLLKQELDLLHFDCKSLWRFPLTEESIIQSWRDLMVFALLTASLQDGSDQFAKTAHTFLHQPWNQKSSYLRLLVALNQFFANMPVQAVDLDILEGGSVPIELGEYCPWQAQPYSPYHAEFGTLLCVLAYLTQNNALKEKVLKIAKWHLNTLDFDFSPLVGLFAKEKNGAMTQQIVWNYLFFYALSHLLGISAYAGLTKKYKKFIESIPAETNVQCDFLAILLEKFIEERGAKGAEEDIILSHHIHDPSTALVGVRKEAYHSICTLHGTHTGLGSIRNNDVCILNYGPHYLPLEECGGFGIEGNHLSDHGIRQSSISMHEHGFTLRGCSRLVDRPVSGSSTTSGSKKLSGIWFEVEQEFQSSQFDLKTQFLGFDGWDSVVFSFFVKTKACQIGSRRLVPCTLDCYDGKMQEIVLEGQEHVIRLISSYEGSMQVIPLSGGSSFWGADFLIAYSLDSNQRKYDWKMHLEEKNGV